MAKLSRAPVFLVVAQVLHSPILKLGALIPDLQDQLRKEGYPGYRESRRMGFEVRADPKNPEGPKLSQKEAVAHVFTSRDSTESIVVREKSISYQTVEYDSMEVFEAAVAKAIRVTSSVLAPDSFTRIGLRFLDAVSPLDGELGSYIRQEFLGWQLTLGDDWGADYTFSEAALTRQDRRIKARVLSRSTELSYPVDLVETAPAIPERFRDIDGVHAIIDSDAVFGGERDFAEEFDVDVVVGHLRNLKSDLNEVFKAVVTEKALLDWR